jgi:hypothetical protein
VNDFVNRTVKVFDTLTLIVMLEQCDFDYTMVDFYKRVRGRWGYEDSTAFHSSCLACLLRRHTVLINGDDGRSALLDKVHAGDIQIIRAFLRTELTKCPGCGSKNLPQLNPDWQKFIPE